MAVRRAVTTCALRDSDLTGWRPLGADFIASAGFIVIVIDNTV
jgi:hypothetical protein